MSASVSRYIDDQPRIPALYLGCRAIPGVRSTWRKHPFDSINTFAALFVFQTNPLICFPTNISHNQTNNVSGVFLNNIRALQINFLLNYKLLKIHQRCIAGNSIMFMLLGCLKIFMENYHNVLYISSVKIRIT